jgi:serine/threonine-protein phosphatase PGAM5
MNWNFIKKVSTVSAGSALVWFFNKNEIKTVFNATSWDYDWDKRNREIASTKIVKRSADYDEKDVKEKAPTARRHLILIRHGQYNLDGATDKERILTELGRSQAKLTGERLKQLEIPFSDVVISTMSRAQETGKIILEQLPKDKKKLLPITNEPLIEEGAPIPPEPKIGGFRPEFMVR